MACCSQENLDLGSSASVQSLSLHGDGEHARHLFLEASRSLRAGCSGVGGLGVEAKEQEVEDRFLSGAPGQIRAGNSTAQFGAFCPSCSPPWGRLNVLQTFLAGRPLCWTRLH